MIIYVVKTISQAQTRKESVNDWWQQKHIYYQWMPFLCHTFYWMILKIHNSFYQLQGVLNYNKISSLQVFDIYIHKLSFKKLSHCLLISSFQFMFLIQSKKLSTLMTVHLQWQYKQFIWWNKCVWKHPQ